MLDHKARKAERQVEVKQESIAIPFPSYFSQQLALIIPPISKMDLAGSAIYPSIDVSGARKEISSLGSELCQYDLDRYLVKYEKFHRSETFMLRLAQTSFYSGDIDRAEDFFGQLMDISQNEYFREAYGDFLIDSGRVDEAHNIFFDGSLSSSIYSNLRRAFFFIEKGDVDAADAHVRKAVSIDPLDFSANIFLATVCIAKGMWMEAISRLKVCLDEDAGSSAALIRIGYCYWRLSVFDKAKFFLRRAVSCNSLSVEALLVYSDVCNSLGVADEALHFLIRYSEIDDSKVEIWERLARASFSSFKATGNRSSLDVCLDALKREMAISPSSRVWNNMGVVVWHAGRSNQAASFLAKALEDASREKDDLGFPLFNMAGVLIENKQFSMLKNIFSIYFTEDGEPKYLISRKSDQLFIQYLIMLEGIGERERAIKLCETRLAQGVEDMDVRSDLLNRMVYYYSAISPDSFRIREIERRMDGDYGWVYDLVGYSRHRVFNNLAFAELCFDQPERAKRYLNFLSDIFHVDPYSTATLGMWHLRNGRVDRGRGLYREAISLLSDAKEKNRFRQRMNIEIGAAYARAGESAQARRHFQKALDEKNGLKWVLDEIRRRIKDLR